jgi:hypothetical protein
MRTGVFERLGVYSEICSCRLIFLFLVLIYGGQARLAWAQEPAAEPEPIGFPWDWSHEHVVFSHTSDLEVAALIQQDPRAFHQWLRRNRTLSPEGMDGVATPISLDAFLQATDPRFEPRPPEPEPRPTPERPRPWRESRRRAIKRDWGVSLGSTKFNNVSNSTPVYPAKYTFNVNATPSCTSDYVVFPTGNKSNTSNNPMNPNGQAAIIGFDNLYSTQPSVGGYCDKDGPTVKWAYVNVACSSGTSSNDPILSSPVLSLDGTKVAWVSSTGKGSDSHHWRRR